MKAAEILAAIQLGSKIIAGAMTLAELAAASGDLSDAELASIRAEVERSRSDYDAAVAAAKRRLGESAG